MLAATHCLRMGLPDVFDDVEVLALYIGALGHDAGHFRLNNAFLKNSKHTLFRKYPDSVLENFHLGLVFELVEDPEVGIAEHLDPAQLARFKELVTHLILATDMSKHRILVDRFKDWMTRSKEEHAQRRRDAMLHDTIGSNVTGTGTSDGDGDGDGDGSIAPSDGTYAHGTVTDDDGYRRWAGWVEPAVADANLEDKTLVMQLLLKCADLGNVVRPLEMADAWGKRIMEEFYQQGEKELALDLPLTTFPNRKNFDYIFARHQNGFLVNVVKPLFETFTQLTDDDTRESVLSCAAENGDAWSQRENANRPGANKGGAKKQKSREGSLSLVQRSRSSFSNAPRSSSSRFKGNTQHWMRAFKESNLTMLTSNAMEMKGLEIAFEENYGAGDEVRAAVRLCVPFIPRLELIRLAELGLLGMSDATVGSAKRLPFLRREHSRMPVVDVTAHAAAHLQSGVDFDAAVAVVSFGGFLELMRRALDGAGDDDDRAQVVSGALSKLLGQAVRAVHANGGDVVRMGFDGMACVFPMSGPGGVGRDVAVSRTAGAVLRASKCAFQLVSQLSFSTPELSALNADDEATVTPAQTWPGLRKYSAGLRVLVVETLQLSRMTLGRLLDHFGVMAHFAENASQAAAACANMEFDVMFMGLMLPEVDGYGVSRHIREYGGPVNGKAYIVALTSVDTPELLSQCQAAGMNEVMQKPTSMKLLHGVFKRAKRHAREEKKREKMSRGRLNLGGLSADEVALHERQRPRRINSYAPVDPFARREKDPDAADKDKDKDKKRVPVNLPRYTDMLLASSAARARQGSASQSSHVKSGRHDGDGDAARSRGLLARIAAALCGGGGRRLDLEPPGRGGAGESDERGADRDSPFGVAGSYARPSIDVRGAPVALAKYKGSSGDSALNKSTEGAVAAYTPGEDEKEEELFESDGETDNEADVDMPVCITVTATVGFGRVAVLRVGGSSAYAVNTSRDTLVRAQRERGQHNASPVRGERQSSGGDKSSKVSGTNRNVSGITWDDAADLLLHASRDEVFAIDAPSDGSRPAGSCPAAARAAAGGPGDGGPFQQCATMTLLSTAGDATMSPVAWRIVRDHVVADAPPRLRGGVRLNRLHVHEVVPPLTNHVLAQTSIFSIIPRAPDPVLTLIGLAGLLPRPLRAAVLEVAPATAQALERQARIIEERASGGDSGSDAGQSGSGRHAAGHGSTANRSEGSAHGGRLVVEMPKLRARIFDAVEVVLCVPGPSSAVKGHCVSGDTTVINANIYTTATAAVMDLVLRFPGAVLSRATSDVLFRRDVDAATGGSGGGGDGVVYYCTFPIAALGASGGGKDPYSSLFDTGGSGNGGNEGRAGRALASERLRDTNHQAPVMAVAFALAARAAMAHLGHTSVSLGVAMGETVAMPAGEQGDRCEWSVVGDAVSRAERLAEFADSEVLCDLRVQRACVGQRLDFDPVPHASGDDTARARNLAPGVLDSILAKASASAAGKGAGGEKDGGMGGLDGGRGGGGVFGGMTSGMGVLELRERGKIPGDGLAPGPAVLMPADLVETYGDTSKQRSRRKGDGATIAEEEEEDGGSSNRGSNKRSSAGGKDPDSKNSSKDEIPSKDDAATERAAKPSPSAATALSAAAAACAAADALYRAERPGPSARAKRPPNLPAISRETTLMAAKRVITEAQESMSPRLLFLEGPPHSGKTKAASAVLDMPEVRRLWLLRVRGCQPEGSGFVAGAQPLKPFVGVFRQLLGFAEETSWRSRKNATVALLESCGDALDRFGRYAKPILELLELEEPEGYSADGRVRGTGSGSGSQGGGSGAQGWQELGTSDSGSDKLSDGRLSGSGLALGERTPSFSGASGKGPPSRSNSRRDAGLSLLTGAPARAPSGSSRNSVGRSGSHAGRAASFGSGSGSRLATNNAEIFILDAMSSAAVNDAYEFLSPVATAALLADGFGDSYIPLEPHAFDETDSDDSDDRDEGEGADGDVEGKDRESPAEKRPRRNPRALGDVNVAISNARRRQSMDVVSSSSVVRRQLSTSGALKEIKSTGRLSLDDSSDEAVDPPKIGIGTYPVIAGRLSASVAFTRQRNGVQRRDHNSRFTACVDRRKLSLASLLISEEGVKRACKALALMLQRLLLGRSTQAAPAQPSIPGFLLFVEDAHMLDPLSMGLVRAILEECSIPLVVMMTHRERGSKVSGGAPGGGRQLDHRGGSSIRKGGAKALHRLESIPSGRNLSLTDAVGNPSDPYNRERRRSTDDTPLGGANQAAKNDAWRRTIEHMAVIDATSKTWDRQARRQLESMLAQVYSTTVDLAPMSQSDLRALVENCAASRLLPRDDRRASVDYSSDHGHVSDHQGSDSDNSSQTSAGTSASGGGGAGSFASSRRAEIVGLPASLHQAIYSQTGGNALFAVATCELLCDSGAVSVTESKTHGVREVKIRADESNLALSASRITSMSLAEVTAENIRRSLSVDGSVAIGVLSALGECFGATHACEVVIRALARSTREEDPHGSAMDREEQRLLSEAAARAALSVVDVLVGESSSISADGVPRISFAPPEKESDALAVEAGLDAAEYSARAAAAVSELVTRGYLTPDWASVDDAFGAAEVLAALAHVEFAGDGLDFPLRKPKSIGDHYEGRPRGGEGSRGRVGRVALLRFVNEATRRSVYNSVDSRRRRAAHIDAVVSLREEAVRAEEWLNDPAAAASHHEAVARHLAVLSAADVAVLEAGERSREKDVVRQLGAVEVYTIGGGHAARQKNHSSASTVEATDSERSLGAPSTGTLASSSAESAGWTADDVHPREAAAAAGAFALRVRCHENAALAHLRRGTQLLALASIASAGVAAAAWTDACVPLGRAFHSGAVDAKNARVVRAALLDADDRKTLAVRSAAWAILANRLTLGLGDGTPPLLFCGLRSGADDGAFAPLRNLRRGMQILGKRWPLDDPRMTRSGDVGAERRALCLVHAMFPAAFGRDGSAGFCLGCFGSNGSNGGEHGVHETCVDSNAIIRKLSGRFKHVEPAVRGAVAKLGMDFYGEMEHHGAGLGVAASGARGLDASVMAGHDAWAMEVDDFEPIGAMPPGIGDVVAYGKQLSKHKNVSKQTRDVARKTLALVACVELSLVTIWSGRLQPACHAVTAHGRAFADCTQQSVVDAAALVAAAAVLSPERQRGDLLDAAQRMLDLEGAFAARLTDGDKPRDGGEPSPQVAGEGTVAARAAREATKLRTSTDARSTLAQGRKQKLTFARTPPPPRSGPALLLVSFGRCCQGDWVTARHAAGACVAITEKGWGDARLGDLARCLGAVADAHLGRWEDALAAATSLMHDRSSHAEIAPWCLATRVAALTATRRPDSAVALWKKALRREPFAGLRLDKNPLSTAAEAGADMPAFIAVRAFAAQALWASGAAEEAVAMIEQLCAQLRMVALASHPLMPSAALAVGETVARASYVGLASKRQGREMMAHCHSFLAQRASRLLPFAADLAVKLRKVAPPGFI